MRWINKRNKENRKRGHAIVGGFLRRGWNAETDKYINTSYDSLKGERKIERLLLREQGYHCCYCMRAISVKYKTTIEHILPRKTKKDNYNAICHYLNSSRFMKRYVRWTDEPPRQKMKVPPYPHYCAYENLVASCDGSIWDKNQPDIFTGSLHNTCNNIRKDKEIIPLFYDSQIERKLIYERDGELTYNETKYGETIGAIKLEHGTLKLIRRAWAQIANTLFTVDDVKKAVDNDRLRLTILDSMVIAAADYDFLSRTNIWELLYEYRWFYDYFKYRRDKIKYLT